MKIFLMGATPSFDVTKFDSIADRLAQTGGNTGNQLIAYGLTKPLVFEDVSWDFRLGPERVSAEFDLILIAAANFLFPGFDFGGMAEFIERTHLPVAIVGLGAQAKDYSSHIPLKPGTERLMRVVAERAQIIGVRGPFTAEVLEEMNIHHVQIVEERTPPRVFVERCVHETDHRALVVGHDREFVRLRLREPSCPHGQPVGEDVAIEERMRHVDIFRHHDACRHVIAR